MIKHLATRLTRAQICPESARYANFSHMSNESKAKQANVSFRSTLAKPSFKEGRSKGTHTYAPRNKSMLTSARPQQHHNHFLLLWKKKKRQTLKRLWKLALASWIHAYESCCCVAVNTSEDTAFAKQVNNNKAPETNFFHVDIRSRETQQDKTELASPLPSLTSWHPRVPAAWIFNAQQISSVFFSQD